MNRSTRKVAMLGCALVASLAFAVQARAATRPDDRYGPRGVGATPTPVHVRPDDRAGLRVVEVTSPATVGRPEGRTLILAAHVPPDDRALGARSAGVSVPVSAPVVVRVSRVSFDWGDAGIGAAAGAGLVLLTLGAALLVRHRRAEPRLA